MKRKTLIIIIVSLVIVLVALYIYKRSKNKPAAEAPAGDSHDHSGSTATVPAANDKFPLKVGSNGENVKYLQRAINRIAPPANLVVDGDFGNKTYTAIILYIGTSYYPVSQAQWTYILNKSNNL